MTLALLLWSCDGGLSEEVPTEGDLFTLTYNVHGLPSEITGDDTPSRIEQIAPLLPGFDLIGLQEDFDETLHGVLDSALDHESRLWFDEALPDRVYGSGLSSYAGLSTAGTYTEHYEDCHGILDSSSDCLASKGFTVMTLVLGGEVTLDFYNTHLEAGGGQEDEDARATQVEQLVASLEDRSAGNAVIFVGDFNLHEDEDPEETLLYERLVTGAGLSNACTVLDCPENRIDKFLYRSNDTVTLEPSNWTNEPGFEDTEGVPLSDHDALSVSFSWTAVAP